MTKRRAILITQFSIPAVVYRGGTSRGIFFHKKDLPGDQKQQEDIFLHAIDAYNPSQINGLGSGTSHSSKVVVISPPSVKDADVNYTFYQVGIGEEIVDDKGTCGNLMAAVGAFTVDEGLVRPQLKAEYVEVSAFNTNIGKVIRLKVPISHGLAKVTGDYTMPGLRMTGAKFIVDILSPGGAKTGKTLPLGIKDTITTSKKMYDVSFVDAVNPCVFIPAKDLGVKGTELNLELSQNDHLLKELEEIRVKVAVAAGMANTIEEARQTPSIPKVALVTEPKDYKTSTGKVIKANEVDIVAKMVSMGKFHRTFAGSGLYNLAAASLLPETVANTCSVNKDGSKEQVIRIGHPEGVANVRVALTKDQQDIAFVGLDRTARRIMKGEVYIPK